MGNEYGGSPKPHHQLEWKRKRLTWILAVSGLCVLFYVLGAWQQTITTTPSQLYNSRVATCNDANTFKSSSSSSLSSKKTDIDFNSHHQLEMNSNNSSSSNSVEQKHEMFPACDISLKEYTPCQDPNRGRKFERDMLKYRERHCPTKEELIRCLIPAPPNYKTPFKWPQSRDYAWYDNIPHKELSIEKAVQNWIQVEGDRFRFPGGGTMFPRGADAYIDDISDLIPSLSNGTIRTGIDTGCGVASWGAYLLKRDIVAMSFAPRDTHEAQVWFALERGVPAMIGVMASKRLPYPARAFDMAHCSRCLIPWYNYDGLYLTEVDRVLRPGGYWILSGPPIRWKTYWRGWERTQEDLKQEQDAIERVAKSLCWNKVIEKGDLAIWQKPCATNYTSSDSDCSDNDAPTIGAQNIHCCKARVAAIVCIQDLCRVDPKLFTSQWTMLLPTNDVLQPRKYEATLMTCLLFDPYLKARIASASTLLSMLDGPTSVFLQVAEYKDSVKRGSFTSLSSSLGQILMQLHTGILFLIKHETRGGLLPSVFKILMLLISSTPYSRMPGDLLPTVISSLQAKLKEGFPQRSDQSSLLAIVINSLAAAISSSPSSPKVSEMFQQEISQENYEDRGESGVLSSIFQYSESVNNPTLSLEALQALRAVSHHYPDIIALCWTHISSILYGILKVNSSVPSWSWKRNPGSVGEKVITAAVKVLDECLRAISGFKGTEDIFDDQKFDTPFTSDYTRSKKVSSAPSYGSESREVMKNESESCSLGTKQWSEALEKHLPLVLSHTSSMVRTASVTCFAGLTSSVFSSLSSKEQNFVLSSTINAALNDEVPSVRSSACRAIGVITCFPLISQSAEMLGKFTHAVEFNTHDSLVLVRIAASWALANICDSLRHFVNADSSRSCSVDQNESSRLTAVPLQSALRMTKDNDKIKANAVRALGNLSRFVNFTSQSGVCSKTEDNRCFPIVNCIDKDFLSEDPCWLGRMVQTFLSCVATGNVKVQWNVCRALSNLFMNETLELGDMNWASSVFSILLLLLRDSPNYKIRIQAAAALAVPATIVDYGESFSDVIKGVEHTVENLSSEQILPSSFKYRIALEKQLTSTMLHVLGLAACTDSQPVKDFLVKKASFLEEWFKVLVSSLGSTNTSQVGAESDSTAEYQKRRIISMAITSLIQAYKSRNLIATAEKLEKLINNSVG